MILLKEIKFYSAVLLSLNSLQRTHQLSLALGPEHPPPPPLAHHGNILSLTLMHLLFTPNMLVRGDNNNNNSYCLIVFPMCSVWHNVLKTYFYNEFSHKLCEVSCLFPLQQKKKLKFPEIVTADDKGEAGIQL